MSPHDPETDALLARAAGGDPSAGQQLLARYRDRLRRMVAVRLDPRVAARLDPSDVVQEALLEAAGKLPDYLRQRPLPFYPWLRRLAWERLLKLHQRHRAAKRDAARDERMAPPLPDGSALELAQRLVASGTSPSGRAVRAEMRDRVRAALVALAETDREVLVLRYLEGMTTAEVAAVLGLSESAVKMRHRRALDRLSRVLGDDSEGGPS
jgi:RNA polymerase sigma-70 factor (ECF subfamily)